MLHYYITCFKRYELAAVSMQDVIYKISLIFLCSFFSFKYLIDRRIFRKGLQMQNPGVNIICIQVIYHSENMGQVNMIFQAYNIFYIGIYSQKTMFSCGVYLWFLEKQSMPVYKYFIVHYSSPVSMNGTSTFNVMSIVKHKGISQLHRNIV